MDKFERQKNWFYRGHLLPPPPQAFQFFFVIKGKNERKNPEKVQECLGGGVRPDLSSSATKKAFTFLCASSLTFLMRLLVTIPNYFYCIYQYMYTFFTLFFSIKSVNQFVLFGFYTVLENIRNCFYSKAIVLIKMKITTIAVYLHIFFFIAE